MTAIIKFLRKLSPFVVLVIILGLSILITYLVGKYIDNPVDPITKTVSTTIDEYKDKVGKITAKTETNKQPTLVGIDPAEYQRVKDALGIEIENVLALNNIKAQMADSLKIVKLQRDQANNKVWNWETKKESGSIITATMNEKDSILHTKADIKLNTTDYVEKGGLFRKDKYYTDIYSPDQNIKVNGVTNFRKETFVKPKRIGLGIQVGYGLTAEGKAVPYVGVGASFNLVNL